MENDDQDGVTVLEVLGITRTDEWIQDGDKAVAAILAEEEVATIFANMSLFLLKEKFPQVIRIFTAVRPITEATASLCALYFQLGYYKGLAQGEDREEAHKLDKLMGDSNETA